MADVVPSVRSDAWFQKPNQIWWDSTSLTAPYLTSNARRVAFDRLHLNSYYFTNVGATTDWASAHGVVGVSWQPNTVSDELAPIVGTQTSIRFDGSGTEDGWLHVLSSGSQRFTTTNDITPVQRGTAGYLQPGSIYVSQRSATPNNLSNGRIERTANLRFQVYPFSVGAGADVWKTTSERRCAGIVACAWQSSTASVTAAVTLNASGDVVFNSSPGGVGWLWVWRCR